MKELIKLWGEYQATDRYTSQLTQVKASGMGMGFLAGEPADIFTDFMDWLIEKQGTSA